MSNYQTVKSIPNRNVLYLKLAWGLSSWFVDGLVSTILTILMGEARLSEMPKKLLPELRLVEFVVRIPTTQKKKRIQDLQLEFNFIYELKASQVMWN